VLEDGAVHHTYSAYERGVDGIWGMYQWLDRAPKGRNETGVWWRHRDNYDNRRSTVVFIGAQFRRVQPFRDNNPGPLRRV
jgi:hypothetical protein